MEVVVLVYDGVSASEALGPWEVLRQLPDTSCRYVAETPGRHVAHSPAMSIEAPDALEHIGWTDVLVVPGGFGCRQLIGHRRLVEGIQHLHNRTRWTTAVSTGSVLLAAAGVLNGREATTHWLAQDILADFGAILVNERVVRAGRVLTATGPAAGIEMAMWVAAQLGGDAVARAIRTEMANSLHTSLDPEVLRNAATVAGTESREPASSADVVLYLQPSSASTVHSGEASRPWFRRWLSRRSSYDVEAGCTTESHGGIWEVNGVVSDLDDD